MKCKLIIKLILIFISTVSLCLASNEPVSLFSEEQAFFMLYGNYDTAHKIAVWENMTFPSKRDKRFFWDKKTGIVSRILFVPFKDQEKEKIFLLTKTTPVGIPFSCHACAPLVGAAIFSKKNHSWEIESQNRFLLYAGEYGEAPLATLVTKDGKPRIELQIEYHGEGVTKRKVNIISISNHIKLIKENDHAFTY